MICKADCQAVEGIWAAFLAADEYGAILDVAHVGMRGMPIQARRVHQAHCGSEPAVAYAQADG